MTHADTLCVELLRLIVMATIQPLHAPACQVAAKPKLAVKAVRSCW